MTFDSRGLPPPETLHELFDRHHIELHEMPIPGRQHGGPRSKIYCPECHGGREKEKNFYVAIDRDGQGAAWMCFRANNCGCKGGGRLKGAPERPAPQIRHYRRPTLPVKREVTSGLVDVFMQFKISLATMDALGIYRTERRMPVIGRDGKQVGGDVREKRPVIAYPYYVDGELVNVKYKAIYRRGDRVIKRFAQEFNAEPSLFNIDNFETDEWGIIVEGEDDVAACYEAGWKQATTVVDGSPPKLSENFDRDTDEDQRYVALYGEPRLDRLKKVYLAGDMDEAGQRHMEEVARRIGKGRCWQVRWPGGCKDAKDTLEKRGPEAVTFAIENAAPYPLEGVHVITDEEIANLHAGIRERRIITGHKAIDDRFSLSGEGLFIVTTGISGRGKTTFWNGMSVLYTERNEEEMKLDRLLPPFHTVICSAEMKPHIMASRLIGQRANQSFTGSAMVEQVPLDRAMDTYLPWVRRHFTFLRWADRATQPTITWLLERIRDVVQRTGAKLVIVDPWQEFDDEMPDRERNHSRWIGKQLQRFIGLTVELAVNIVMVVHPTKMKPDKEGKLPIPEGNDISDSIQFYSRSDSGTTIHRANFNSDEMLFRVWKVRDGRFARHGDTVLRVDPHTYRIYPKPVPVSNTNEIGNMRTWADK